MDVAMRTVDETIQGPVTVREDLCLNGIIAGDASVGPGVRLDLNGTVAGDLTIEASGEVALRGTLGGALINYGKCDVWGVVRGPIYDEESGLTTLHPGAVHSSDIST
jgi:hypothetical protein